MTRLRGGACPALSPPSGQTPQTPVRVRKEPGLPAPPARGPAGPHSPAQRTPRSPCPQRRCHQKDKFPRVADLQKMISFLKIFSTWPLVPNDRKSHAVGGLQMNLQRPQSQPTSPPRGEGPRPFLVNTGGGAQHGRGTSAWGPLVRYANQVGVAEGPQGFSSSLLTCSWSLPPATREHHTRLG